MPNGLAYLALIAWPIISLFVYARTTPLTGTLWTILGGYLILPVRTYYDFPLVPPLDKESISALTALAGCIIFSKNKISFFPDQGIEKALCYVLLITPFFTSLNNSEIVRNVGGLSIYDGLSASIDFYIVILPFILGAQLVKSSDDQVKLFKWITISALIYSLPSLLEIRISPQLHVWFYGFFPHTFAQQVRYDGYRPVVFLGHGLLVAIMFSISLGCTLLLWKEKISLPGLKKRAMTLMAVLYLFGVLILCKSFGAIFFGLVFLVAFTFCTVRIIRIVALVLTLTFLLYPMLSILELFPHAELLNLFASIDAERAESLAFRFFHENLLLELAQEKLFFGWGGFGRNRYADSVTDGFWIIALGTYGLFGFLSLFGLASMGLVRGVMASKKLKNNYGGKLLAGHTLIVSVILIDQIANASLNSWTWFLAGSLLGCASSILKEKGRAAVDVKSSAISHESFGWSQRL